MQRKGSDMKYYIAIIGGSGGGSPIVMWCVWSSAIKYFKVCWGERF